jgi:hypothetical protein
MIAALHCVESTHPVFAVYLWTLGGIVGVVQVLRWIIR